MTVDRIEKLKEMFLNTDLKEGAEIVAPPGLEWKSVTDQVRDLIRAHAGQSLPVIEGDRASLSGLKDRHWVALGSAMNNPALMALYRRKYAFVDDFYPGGDGYVIQTVHNPECCGHNVLLVGASRPEGAAAGLERLEEILKRNGGRFGYTNLAHSATHRAILPDTTPEAFRERTEAAFRENTGVGVINSGITYGMLHHFTHDLNCARMFKDVLFYYEDLYEDLVRSRYNGERDLFWVKGRYILTADSLKLLKDADYDLRCLWRTLGEVRLEGDGLRVEQKGVFFRIRNADDSDKSLETEEPRIAGQDPYKGYEHAQGPIRIFKQRKTLRGKAGDVERYFNLMVAGAEAEVDACRVVRVAEGVVRVEGPDGATVFGLAEQGVSLGSLRVVAGAFALAEGWVALLCGTRLTAGEVSFESDAPVHLILHPGEGRGEVRVKTEARVTVRGVPGLSLDGAAVQTSEGAATGRLSPGAHRVTFQAFSPDALKAAVRSGAPYVHRRAPKQNRFTPSGKSPLRPAWETGLEGQVRCLDARDGRIAIGTVAGQVALLDREGRVQWTRGMGAEVRTVHLTELEGEGALLAGGRDCALTRFSADGVVRWKREFIPSHRRDQIVNAVTTSDLTGDGKTEVVVATDGWLVWALTPEDEEIWQRQIEHHAAQTLVISDVEGDGRREILVGTEYHTSNMLEADGTIRWTVRGGPCFTALALADLNGDGVKESVYGAMDGNVYALDSTSGKTLWTANLGDDVRHGVVVTDGRKTGLVAGSESGNVAFLSGDGQSRWRRDLNAPVTGLALLDPGRGRVAAGTSEGWIVLLSLDGEIVGSLRRDAGVTALSPCRLPGGAGLLVGTERGLVTALAEA